MVYYAALGQQGPTRTRTTKTERTKKMATSNFKSMRDFPLIVTEDLQMKVCPECGCGQGGTTDKCECCGADLTEVEEVYDELGMQDRIREMEEKAEELNEYLTFFTVSVVSGYYSGVQFYVDEKYCDVEEMDNDESNYEFGMCRSKMLRKYKSEGNWLRRALQKAKKEIGLMELGVVARFSNGETMYTEISPEMPKRAVLKVAVNAA